MTDAELERLCELHISSTRSANRLKAIATDLSGEIAQVVGIIDVATSASETYDQHLGRGLQSIERTQSHQALKPVVEVLVIATREMESKTRALELKLEESRVKTIDLQKDLELLRLENLTDPLTLIGNRQYFDESLAKMTAVANERGLPLSLLFADIDHFKKFNDSFGHQVGDQVLRLVASTIKEALRDGDVAARYGGEEFAVLLPNAQLDVGKLVAQRICLAIMRRDIKLRSSQQSLGRITISIGVAQFRQAEAAVEFVGRADTCLYAAKRWGRNRVVSEHDPEFLTNGDTGPLISTALAAVR